MNFFAALVSAGRLFSSPQLTEKDALNLPKSRKQESPATAIESRPGEGAKASTDFNVSEIRSVLFPFGPLLCLTNTSNCFVVSSSRIHMLSLWNKVFISQHFRSSSDLLLLSSEPVER